MLNSIFGKLSETLDNLKDFKITDEQLAKLKELVETASKSDLVQTYKTLSTPQKGEKVN
jgi:cation transport regulator ChaC